jgi:electron transfer flavoprotein alpha subunit
MNVLVYAELNNKRFKKAIFEAIYYGKEVAKASNGKCIALVLGESEDSSVLAKYGADKIVEVKDNQLSSFDSQQHTLCLADIMADEDANLCIFAHTANGRSLAGRLSAKLNAGLVSMVNALPSNYDKFTVQRAVFSGKAFANYAINSNNKIITLAANSLKPIESENTAEVVEKSISLPDSAIKVLERKTVEGIVPLPEAELVVSAGRGMKGPENWGIIEDLANELGATTACSRPVADSDWRPHHEHVGQTGVAIRPNLYIAIGISGAIQHLAGVNNSKTIVVINKDPEAPFFKAADYGVEADLFDVVPKLTEAFKKYKAQHS